MKLRLAALLLCIILLLSGCVSSLEIKEYDESSHYAESEKDPEGTSAEAESTGSESEGTAPEGEGTKEPEEQGDVADLGDDNKTFGDSLDGLGVYEGYFENESADIEINCISGTDNAYKLEGTTLTFTAVSEETAYSISGAFRGNIVIDVGDGFKFELELCGLSLVSDSTSPITVKSGKKVTLKAKKETKNYVYDMRAAADTAAEGIYSGAIHSQVDLEVGGKGELVLVYSDGREDNLGVVVGRDGVDGADGIDGAPGEDGADGKNGTDGQHYNYRGLPYGVLTELVDKGNCGGEIL